MVWSSSACNKRATSIESSLTLNGPEVWHYYAGAPARMLLLHADRAVSEPTLGIDLVAGERPQIWVDAGVCMGVSTAGDWTLLGTTMAPPYNEGGVRFFSADELIGLWPSAGSRISELTR